MKITKKQLIALFFSLAYCLPVAFSHYLALPARADEALVGEQIGLQEVKPLFGGGRAEEDPRLLVVRIISLVLTFIGTIFLALAIYAGFKYMTAGGNENQVSDALALLKNAIIGFIIVASAWAISRFSIIMIYKASRNAGTDYNPYGM